MNQANLFGNMKSGRACWIVLQEVALNFTFRPGEYIKTNVLHAYSDCFAELDIVVDEGLVPPSGKFKHGFLLAQEQMAVLDEIGVRTETLRVDSPAGPPLGPSLLAADRGLPFERWLGKLKAQARGVSDAA